jgi:hypothetical protein
LSTKDAKDMPKLITAEPRNCCPNWPCGWNWNRYRARAYSRAADNLALSPVPLDQLIADGRLKEIPGIGDALAAVITKIYETGRGCCRGTIPW